MDQQQDEDNSCFVLDSLMDAITAVTATKTTSAATQKPPAPHGSTELLPTGVYVLYVHIYAFYNRQVGLG